MRKIITTTRNLLAATAFVTVGMGWYAPAPAQAAADECIHSTNCTACSFGDCIYSCCGSCEEITVQC